MKREMLSDYQLKIADLYNIPINNDKKHMKSAKIYCLALMKKYLFKAMEMMD